MFLINVLAAKINAYYCVSMETRIIANACLCWQKVENQKVFNLKKVYFFQTLYCHLNGSNQDLKLCIVFVLLKSILKLSELGIQYQLEKGIGDTEMHSNGKGHDFVGYI